MGIPVTAKLTKEDRARVDQLLGILVGFQQMLMNLRHNDKVVITVELQGKDTKKDDIQK